jgi:predicted nucleic acid-binding protein
MITDNLYLNFDKLDFNPQEPYLIDTNILVISQSKKESEKKRNNAVFILDYSLTGKYGYLSIQNYIEFVNVMKNKLKSMDDLEIIETLNDFNSVFKLLFYFPETINKAISLSLETKVHFFDALLAQTMLDNNVHLIYTENTKDFNKIPGIKAINPFTDKKITKLCEKAKKQQLKYNLSIKNKKKIIKK